ncbi:hypothetical protein ACWKSP_41065 [Micromonosporaceae bacterium Da 78-11]
MTVTAAAPAFLGAFAPLGATAADLLRRVSGHLAMHATCLEACALYSAGTTD